MCLGNVPPQQGRESLAHRTLRAAVGCGLINTRPYLTYMEHL